MTPREHLIQREELMALAAQAADLAQVLGVLGGLEELPVVGQGEHDGLRLSVTDQELGLEGHRASVSEGPREFNGTATLVLKEKMRESAKAWGRKGNPRLSVVEIP